MASLEQIGDVVLLAAVLWTVGWLFVGIVMAARTAWQLISHRHADPPPESVGSFTGFRIR